MRRARILQEVRQIRFEELYERRQRRDVTMVEAAEMLGITARTVRRRSMRYDAEGREGLQDRRLGRASARAVPVDEALRMVTLYETRDTGWTVKHVHEHWQQAHGGPRSYSWTEEDAPGCGTCGTGSPARGAPQEAAAQTVARHDAPPGRLHA